MVLGVEHPVQNEPGWEMETGKKSIDYNRITMYNNLDVAVLKMIINTPPTYECFKDIMIDKFMENRYQFDKYIESVKKYDKCVMKSSMYGMSCKFNIDDLKSKMSYVYNNYIDQYNKKIETILKKVNESLEQSQEESQLPQGASQLSQGASQKESQLSKGSNVNIKNSDFDEKLVNVEKCKKTLQKIKNEIKNKPKKKYQRKCPSEEAKQYDVGFEKLGISGVMYVVKQSEKGIKRWIKKK
jgi:transcription elongation factor Elf1